jgi:hypothetical protein
MDTADLKVLLKQLNRQLLEQFMYIIRQLVECPLTLEVSYFTSAFAIDIPINMQVEPLINDVKMTALNIFHATNRYRPSQVSSTVCINIPLK